MVDKKDSGKKATLPSLTDILRRLVPGQLSKDLADKTTGKIKAATEKKK